MLNGLDHIWKAAQILAAKDALLDERLRAAAGEFLVALLQPNEWPAELLPAARTLGERLKNLDAIDQGGAKQLAEEILALAVEVEIAFRE